VGYNGEGFPPLWDTTEEDISVVGYNKEKSQDGKQFFSNGTHNAGHFSSIVSHNGRYFPPLWDKTQEVFFRCGIHRKRFFHFGIQRKRFFSIVGYNGKKIIQRRMIFLNVKYLSLPSNKNLRKICYLNSQTNPWKEVKMENYMVHHENFFFSIVGYNTAEIFLTFELK
jgi:hypothetical protein